MTVIQTGDDEHINDLLNLLGDYLDPNYGERRIQRAYAAAQNTMGMPAVAAERLAELARQLREAAEVAEQLAAVRGRS
jgi:hypothetical protein